MAEHILIARRCSGKSTELETLLERAGYALSRTDTVAQTVEILGHCPSLLLLEAELVMQGAQPLREDLEIICRGGDIPCLIYSSTGRSVMELEKLTPWAAEFICHPWNAHEVLGWISSQLTIRHLKGKLQAAYGKLQTTRMELEEGLRSAAHILKCLVPDHPPALENIRMDWSYLPSARVGGDLFNVQRLDEDISMAYILDVSGHGVSSAMVAVAVSQTLSTQPGQVLKKKIDSPPYYEITSPAEVLEVLDRAYPFELFEMFITMCYVLIDMRTGGILYSNAAHPPPLLTRSDGSWELLHKGGTIIGLGENIPFEMGRAEMRPGDRLYLYTDGILEHADPRGELYGEGRLLRQLLGLHSEELEAVSRKVMESLLAFNGGIQPEDDVTLLGIEFAKEL